MDSPVEKNNAVEDYLLEEYENLLESIEKIMAEKNKPYKSLVEIGPSIYAKAKVDDPKTIIINIGMDVYAEMTLEEASSFLKEKIQEIKNSVN